MSASAITPQFVDVEVEKDSWERALLLGVFSHGYTGRLESSAPLTAMSYRLRFSDGTERIVLIHHDDKNLLGDLVQSMNGSLDPRYFD